MPPSESTFLNHQLKYKPFGLLIIALMSVFLYRGVDLPRFSAIRLRPKTRMIRDKASYKYAEKI